MLDPATYSAEFLAPLNSPPHVTEESVKIANKVDQKIKICSAYDLRSREFKPIRYIVPGYIAEGCTLLAGRPKLGKSWLVLEAGLAVAKGGTCLGGIPCEEGDVLYLALEDNERRLQKRINMILGSSQEWPKRFCYATEWLRAEEGGLEAIRDWILSVDTPRLIIVDVLAMFKPVRKNSDAYAADYSSIKGLQSLASEFQVAIVVVHHTRKGGSEVDPFEKVSGTLGLSGAADTTLILDRDGNGATIYGRGRDIEEIESAVEFDKASCRWSVLGQVSAVRQSDERNLILEVLLEADEATGPREISLAIGAASNNVTQLLHKMAQTGEVRKLSRGRYIHPNRTDLIVEAPSDPDKIDKEIRNEGSKRPYQ